MEGRYDAIRGHRTGSNTSPPISVPVSPSPVSREASRDFVALDLWLHTRYQISKINFWHHMVYLVPGIYLFERSEFLIATSKKKKTDRLCVCVCGCSHLFWF